MRECIGRDVAGSGYNLAHPCPSPRTASSGRTAPSSPFFVDLDEHTTALPREELVLFGAEVVRPSLLEHFPDNPDMRDAELVVCAPAKPRPSSAGRAPATARDAGPVRRCRPACGGRPVRRAGSGTTPGRGPCWTPRACQRRSRTSSPRRRSPPPARVPRARAVTTYKSSCHYRIRNREAEGLRRRRVLGVPHDVHGRVHLRGPGGHLVPGAVTPQQAFSITCNVQYEAHHHPVFRKYGDAAAWRARRDAVPLHATGGAPPTLRVVGTIRQGRPVPGLRRPRADLAAYCV